MNISNLVEQEIKRQKETIQMIAAENVSREYILYPLATRLNCKTAEGTVGNRYHAGCNIIDKIEQTTEELGKKLFKTNKIWVQPHSGSTANMIVIFTLLDGYLQESKKAKILSMSLDQGGHLSHGSQYNIVGKFFTIDSYYVDRETYRLNYETIAKKAEEFKPNIIIAGASSYPRIIEFKKFEKIANENNAILISDIAHIMGLVVSGVHPTPVPHSSFVTSSTYKAGGPRGGIIVAGKYSTEEQMKAITYGVFPGIQSTPNFASIASKGLFFQECMTKKYRDTQKQIVRNAKALAKEFINQGFFVLTDGTDNHKVILDIRKSHNMNGKEAENRLEQCGINVNKNLIPYDAEGPTTTSGIRFGTQTVTRLGMKEKDMEKIADLTKEILEQKLSKEFIIKKRKQVKNMMKEFGEIV